MDDPCNKCDPSVSTSSYSPVNGCQLDMATFNGGSFYADGSSMPESMQPAAMQMTLASMHSTVTSLQTDLAAKSTTSAAKDTTISSLQKDSASKDTTIAAKDVTISSLEGVKTMLLTEKASLQATVDSCEDDDDIFN